MPDHPRLEDRRVLLIDDDAPFRTMVRLMLEGAGYDVEEAGDGATGIKRYLQARCDVVVTDIVMPVIEGFETITNLRRFDPNVKIVAMTGAADGPAAVYLRSAEMLGAVVTLQKPFSATELLAAIADALSRPIA